MASKEWHDLQFGLPNAELIIFSFTTDAGGVVQTQSTLQRSGCGCSIARTGTGAYLITFDGSIVDAKVANIALNDTAAADIVGKMGTFTQNAGSNSTIVVQFRNNAGTATEAATRTVTIAFVVLNGAAS